MPYIAVGRKLNENQQLRTKFSTQRNISARECDIFCIAFFGSVTRWRKYFPSQFSNRVQRSLAWLMLVFAVSCTITNMPNHIRRQKWNSSARCVWHGIGKAQKAPNQLHLLYSSCTNRRRGPVTTINYIHLRNALHTILTVVGHHHMDIDSQHQHWINHTSCTFGKQRNTKPPQWIYVYLTCFVSLWGSGFLFRFFDLFFRTITSVSAKCISINWFVRRWQRQPYGSHGTAETITWSPLATTIKH